MRLSKKVKNEIKETLLKERYTKEFAAFQDENLKLQTQIYEDMFTPEQHKLLAELPKNWLVSYYAIGCKILTKKPSHFSIYRTLNVPRELSFLLKSEIPALEPILLPANVPQYYTAAVSYPPDSTMARRVCTVQDNFAELCRQACQHADAVEKVLSAYSTKNALLTAWPEIEPVVTRILAQVQPKTDSPRPPRSVEKLDVSTLITQVSSELRLASQ